MTAPATYGDLMLRASLGIQAGVGWMQNLPLERREFAETAIDDFRDVLRALKEHTYLLLETQRVAGIVASPAPDPRERAAVRLGEALDDFVGSKPPWAWVGARVSPSPWATAARCVQAAGELMTTHSEKDGSARTPDLEAVLRNPVARQAGFAQVGDMAATLLGGADHLALRCAQAGIPWADVRYRIPDLSEARAHARDVAGVGSLPTWAHLDDLTVAIPPIRSGEPAAQFSDRMMRLRRIAWQDARSDHPSVDSLKIYATLGIAVHAHALAFNGVPPSAHRQQDQIPGRLRPLVVRGRAWQEVSRALLDWRSAQPSDPVVAEDFARVSGLLRAFAPLTGSQPDLSETDRRHLGRAIAAAAAVTTDIGRWNAATVARMGRGHQIYVPARTLTRVQVAIGTERAEAKLHHRCVLANDGQVEAAAALYSRTAPTKSPALFGAEGLSLRVEPLRRSLLQTAPSVDPIERSN